MNEGRGEVEVCCAHDGMVAVAEIKPYPANAKLHTDAQIGLLAQVIARHGWRAPITVSKRSGYVVRGHARLEAAKKLGLASVPVDYQDYPDRTAEMEDRIADNRMAELAPWDYMVLSAELSLLETEGGDVLSSGWDAAAMAAMRRFATPDGPSAVADAVSGGCKNRCPNCGFEW